MWKQSLIERLKKLQHNLATWVESVTSRSTSSLEQSGELVSLSSLDIEDHPTNPYGSHLTTVNIEIFTEGSLVTVSDSERNVLTQKFTYNNTKEQSDGSKEKEEENRRN